MRDTTLLQMALAPTPPWTVISSDFDAKAQRLDTQMDFPAGGCFICPNCGASDCPTYDTEKMTWRHLDSFWHQACHPTAYSKT